MVVIGILLSAIGIFLYFLGWQQEGIANQLPGALFTLGAAILIGYTKNRWTRGGGKPAKKT